MPSVSSPSGVSSPLIVEGADLRPVLLELPAEEVVVGGLAGEAVAVLCQHHMDTSGGHKIPHAVHAWPLKAGAALSGVCYLLKDLIPFSGSVVSQGFDLLGQ